MTDYGHDEAMRDLHNIGQPDTDFYSSREGCRHRLAAYIESLERQNDWLIEYAAALGRTLTSLGHSGFRQTDKAVARAAEEATRDE